VEFAGVKQDESIYYLWSMDIKKPCQKNFFGVNLSLNRIVCCYQPGPRGDECLSTEMVKPKIRLKWLNKKFKFKQDESICDECLSTEMKWLNLFAHFSQKFQLRA